MSTSCSEIQRIYARQQVMGRLLRSLVHELSNPLQAVSGAVRLAQEDIQHPEDLRADLDIIQAESRRMERLIHAARLLYRGGGVDSWETLIEDVLLLAGKELQWHEISWTLGPQWRVQTPPPADPYLRSALLGALQALVTAVGSNTPARLHLDLQLQAAEAQIDFHCTPRPAHQAAAAAEAEWVSCLLTSCGAAFSWTANGAAIRLPLRGGQL